jgi:hypothetical protein
MNSTRHEWDGAATSTYVELGSLRSERVFRESRRIKDCYRKVESP